ncbi:type II toxin-antitoxin system death-on-curing family toxin [Novosphingobium sp.]|uniref:type II toxin-antitoxin system death-on-curing family toxin n=1 Tax=Novosphingobium sp. TaxID=1874826 RepID=UPI002732353E|nr:type II toxin-antitoxin system death-on-curing family toxin [Novosphingobium sp.]MDP3907240.1 type II toxin-antitoxin system death-on-curing family toxin [Novosphingobium sp.]
MNDLEPAILEQYRRVSESYNEVTQFPRPCLSVGDVLRAHYMIANHFYLEGEGIGGIGPKDINALESTVCRQTSGYGGRSKWNGPFEISATLFFGIIKNHSFYDANKRTAFLSMLYQLYSVGFCPSVGEKEIEDFTVEVAENSIEKYSRFRDLKKSGDEDPEVKFIAYWLKKRMRPMNNERHSITFRDLQRILNRYGYSLENPDRNYIDIMREREEKRGFLFKKTELVKSRVGHIGFPRWGAEVPKGTIKLVRSLTKLRHEDGVDSKAFFDGLDSMQSLITTYNAPLLSLAHR